MSIRFSIKKEEYKNTKALNVFRLGPEKKKKELRECWLRSYWNFFILTSDFLKNTKNFVLRVSVNAAN